MLWFLNLSDGKYVKLVMLKKSKAKVNKEIPKPPVEAAKKLPKLLPRGLVTDKKGMQKYSTINIVM